MKSVGIDIGSSSIKIIEMQASSKGFHVSQYIEHALNIAPGADQELEIIEFLREFTSHYDASQTHFITCLRQDQVAIRNKFFPFNDRIKIFKSLAFELEEDLPLSSENAVFDAKIIRTVGAGAEVLACAAPKTHVQKALQRAQDIGVDASLLSSEGTAFANIFEKWNEPPPTTNAPMLEVLDEQNPPARHIQIVLNLGHTRTLLSAFEGTSLIAVRSLLWGGKNVAEAIAKKYELPYLEAVRELQTKAFILTNKQGATFDQVTFSDTIAKTVREMARDLQLSILELKGEFNAHIHGINLTGGTSQIQNLGPFLTQILEIPVNRISVLDQVPNVMFERTNAAAAKAGLALGLAIEGFKKPRNPPINFMRGEFEKENQKFALFWEKWGLTVKVATAALVTLFIYASLRSSFSMSLSERADEALKQQAKTVANLKGKSATESGIKKYIRENKKRASDLKTLSSVAQMNSALDIVKRISEASPSKNSITLDIHSLKVIDNQVNLEGYVGSLQERSLLKKSLTNISIDGKIKEETSNLGALSGKTTFKFSLNVDRGIQKVTR